MVKKRKTKNDLLFRSGFEKVSTDYLTENNVSFEYEKLKLTYTIPAVEKTYTPDVELPNGIIVEYKGYMDAETMKKMIHVIKCNPTLDIRMVFQQPTNKVRKGSKTTYAMWADKNNIKWGVKEDVVKWAKEKTTNKKT